jgi:hypothetical protein
MSFRRTVIVLSVPWNADMHTSPERWDYDDLLDTVSPVHVLAAGPVFTSSDHELRAPSLEVHPTRTTITVADGHDSAYETMVDQCDAAIADQWTVYERQPDGLLTVVCDCPDEATALRVQTALTASRLPHTASPAPTTPSP